MKGRKERPKWLRGVIEGEKKDGDKTPPAIDFGDDQIDLSDLPQLKEVARNPEPPENLPTRLLDNDDQFDFSTLEELRGGPSDLMSEEELKDSVIHLYQHLQMYAPSGFQEKVKPDLVKEHAPLLRKWPVRYFHEYFLTPDIWKKASRTEAVFQEINARMQAGSLKPRE